MKTFDLYSAYYDLLYKDKDYLQETEYVELLYKKFSGNSIPGSKVLEIGCGTGKHACHFGEKDYKVDGFDISQGMIEIANKRLASKSCRVQKNVNFNSLEWGIIKNYDLVISLFHVVSYHNTDDELDDLFLRVNKCLSDDGVFIFDVWHKPAVLSQGVQTRKKVLRSNDVEVFRLAAPTVHGEFDIVDVNYDIFIREKNTELYSHFSEIHSMRPFEVSDIEGIANRNGLKVLHAEEWLSGNPLSGNTWGACFVLSKC